MKGSVFKLLEDFVDANHGEDAFYDLVASCDLQTKEPFVGPGTYPPGDLLALVGAASEKYATPVEDLLHAFGRHAFPTLAGSVPTLLEGLDTPAAFLMNLESVIHTEVRKLDANASPARFTVTEADNGGVRMRYESPFGLFALVEGFLAGVADWYQSPVTSQRESIDGTNATFLVHFDDAPSDSASADRTPIGSQA